MSQSEDKLSSRSDQTGERLSLPLLSLRRKANQINLALLVVLILGIVGVTDSYRAFSSIEGALTADLAERARSEGVAPLPPDEALPGTSQAVSTSRARFRILTISSLVLLLFLTYRLVTVGIRSVAMEVWIRRMGRATWTTRSR